MRDGHRFASPATKARRRCVSAGRRWQSSAEDLGPAAARADQAQQQPDGRGLARAVRAEVADHLARRDLEVEVIESGDAAVALGQPLRADGGVLHAARLRPGLYKRIVSYSLV